MSMKFGMEDQITGVIVRKYIFRLRPFFFSRFLIFMQIDVVTDSPRDAVKKCEDASSKPS